MTGVLISVSWTGGSLAGSESCQVVSALSVDRVLQSAGLSLQHTTLQTCSAGALHSLQTLVQCPPQLGHITVDHLTAVDEAPPAPRLPGHLLPEDVHLVLQTRDPLLVHPLPAVETVLQLLETAGVSGVVSLPLHLPLTQHLLHPGLVLSLQL